jgi:multisubunit Na+/H+ antiporter MnhF subunit
MKLTLRDLIATIVVAAIGVPYIGYLLKGEMPFIKDPRGMSAVGLVLGAVAYFVLRGADAHDRVGKVETVAGIVSLALGLAAVVLAEAAAADVLLAVFMGSILVVWAFELIDHAGVGHWHDRPHGLSHA